MQKKYKIINIVLSCFFFAGAIIPTALAAEDNFQIFNNAYTTVDDFFDEKLEWQSKEKWQKEDLTIPNSIWKKRSKIIDAIAEDKSKRRYVVKKNTLLSIDTKDLFPNSFILHRNKIYRAPYYIFIRQGEEKIEIVNRSLAIKNLDRSKVMSIRIVVDETAPMIDVIPLGTHEQKEGAIVFGKSLTVLVKIADQLAHLNHVAVRENKKILAEQTIDQKNIFLKTITLLAEQEKDLTLSIDASDRLGNKTQKNFTFQSMQKQPRVRVFLKEDATFSKIHKSNLGGYAIKIDEQQEHIIFFETEPKEAKVYVLLEKVDAGKQKSFRRATFQRMNADEGIRIDQAGDLYFYAEDQLGNKSEVEHLTITSDVQKKISIEAQ